MLMNQPYGASRKRKTKFTDLCLPQLLWKVLRLTPNVHDDAMEKWLYLWIHKRMTD